MTPTESGRPLQRVSIGRYSLGRAISVTLGLSAAGAVLGAVAGASALTIGLIVTEGTKAFRDLGLVTIPAAIGAVLGAVCAPLAGWLLLRDIPLGRALRGLTIGTIVGGVCGWFLRNDFASIYTPIIAAALGFLGAAVLLRARRRLSGSRPPELPRGGA